VTRRRGAPTGEVAGALDVVGTLGPGRLDDELVAAATRLRIRIDERLGRGDALTVAALGGGTGVGKSALLNALLGRSVAAEGVRRPTTAVALAAAPDQDGPTTALLDWLEVPERHRVGDALPEGLVVLDLPDHDSVVDDHRRTAVRLAERVDVVVWVVDPVKYARADAHDGPLATLTAHADVLLVVLNRVDELADPSQVAAVADDLRARLLAGGHRDGRVLTTSAATGEGVAALREELTRLAAERTAAAARLAGDAAVLGRRLEDALEALPVLTVDARRVTPALLEAVDAHRAAVDAAALARRDVLQRARSPLARAVSAPIRGVFRAFVGSPAVTGAGVVTPSRASVTERTEAAVTRELGVDAAVGRTHGALDRAVRSASEAAAPDLLDAVGSAGLTPPRSRWPHLLAALRTLAELVAIAGAGWLTALAVVAWLQLPPLPTPDAIGAVPWPTALLLGGLLVRVVLGGLTRLLARVVAGRRGRAVSRRIDRAVREVAEDRLLAPVRAEVADQERLRRAVQDLAVADRAARGRRRR
jgi:hypothetical protein